MDVIAGVLFVILTNHYFPCSGNENIIVYACDCSTEALDRVKETIDASNIAAVEHRFHPFCHDFSVTAFPTWLACNPCRENFTQTSQQHLTG